MYVRKYIYIYTDVYAYVNKYLYIHIYTCNPTCGFPISLSSHFAGLLSPGFPEQLDYHPHG